MWKDHHKDLRFIELACRFTTYSLLITR